MGIIRRLRAIERLLTPPGNRASLESSYRQVHTTGRNGTNAPSAAAGHEKGI